MGTPHSDRLRQQRYEGVVNTLAAADQFTLREVQQRCPAEPASFVTRLVRALERDGLLEPVDGGSAASFRWALPCRGSVLPRWIEARIRGTRITRAPLSERPRERLLAEGPAALRTAELVAILVRAGRPGESALQVGEKVASRFDGCLADLAQAGRGELRAVSAVIGDAAYCQIMAGIELGRRVADAARCAGRRAWRIHGPAEARAYCEEHFARLAADGLQEEIHVVTLDTRHQVINRHRVTRGSLDGSPAHPRDVFRPAIRDAAASLILVHNHPSGELDPSAEDLAVTRRLEQAAEHLGIRLLDHIIVSRRGSRSLREYRGSGR